jgi:putative glutamine amidotransferase
MPQKEAKRALRVLLTPEDGFDSLMGAQNFVVRKQYDEVFAPHGGLCFAATDARLAAEYAAFADALVLTDGGEIHRGRYGEIYADYTQLAAVSQSRDELEFALLDAFIWEGKPILGIGRGARLINIALGGKPDGDENYELSHGVYKIEDGESFADADALLRFAQVARKSESGAANLQLPTALIAGGPAYDRLRKAPSVMINKTYVNALSSGGMLPLLALGGGENAELYAEHADGLVLTGTQLFAPDMSLLPQVMAVEEPLRNAFDERVYNAFKARGKPILGICLGLQVINTFEGGVLRSNFKLTDGVEHMLSPHGVTAREGSVLHELFGGEFIVNSRHNDRIDALADALTATAYSPDGVIEAIEHKSLPIFAVQWHPERTRGDNPEPYNGADMSPLFAWFARICGGEAE